MTPPAGWTGAEFSRLLQFIYNKVNWCTTDVLEGIQAAANEPAPWIPPPFRAKGKTP